MATSMRRGCASNSGLFCVMHVVSCTKSKFIKLSSQSWSKYVTFASKWQTFNCKEADTVSETATKLGLLVDDVQAWGNALPSCIGVAVGYHYECYKRFCDISKINRKMTNTAKDTGTDMEELDDDPVTVDSGEPNIKRALRSSLGGETPRPWAKRHMFPEQCIMCHGSRYKTDHLSGKRKLQRLVTCENIQGGQLLQAARIKEDTPLLLQIDGQDLVARELNYHLECYKNYTRFLSKPSTSTSTHTGYEEAFQSFCDEVIRPRLLQKMEITTLTRLNRSFVKTIRDIHGVDVPYRTWNLKTRLQKTFPQLVFMVPSNRRMSDIVYSEKLSAEDLVQEVLGDTSSEESSTDDEADIAGRPQGHPRSSGNANDLRTLYNAALILKTSCTDVSSDKAWPPTAIHLSVNKASDMVHHHLYNFIAWLVGASTEPEDSKYVTVSDEHHHKLLSIAQDILYMSSKGKIQTPKHTALAVAVRHMTGSAQLVGILNGLGHSISHPSLMEHNTALAKLQLEKGPNKIPAGIHPSHFTTLVWDNIDFGEETLSGKGTTHSTNGIMIQRVRDGQVPPATTSRSVKRTRERTLHPPPTELSPFFGLGKKRGPDCIGKQVTFSQNAHAHAATHPRKVDMAFSVLKYKYSGIPGWTGFNTTLASDPPIKSTVAYLPVIDASPTQMDTVQTILDRSISYADELKEEVVVVVFDQAIYAKAQQIRWHNIAFQKRLVIRLGMFHTKMTFLACIGKRYKDAGLSDILIEAGVIAQGSLNGVMNGHHYNRSMRAHKVMYEALLCLQWEAYIDSLGEVQQSAAERVMERLHAAFIKKDMSSVISSLSFASLLASFSSFVETRSKQNATFAFWTSYIKMVEDVLLLTRASRTGNWDLHLASVRNILPWMFAYDRPNYARYLSAYYMEMVDLPQTHPTAYAALSSGEFAVQRQEGYGFAQVECDLCIEQTCNRDAKTKGGIIGFTTKPGAVLRWLLTRHECSAITNECKEMAGKVSNTRARKDLDKSRISRDEVDVTSVMETMRSMVNPFDLEGDELVHISSGIVASEYIKRDLITAECSGNEAFTTFAKDRLQTGTDDFFKPIKQQRLATFDSMNKKSVSKVKGKTVTLKADRRLFARLMMIVKVRNVDIRHMLTYCLGPVPLSFATEQGTLVKTNKATLMHHLESSVKESATVEIIPPGSIWIIDGMAMLQQLHSPSAPTTFYNLAEFILQKLTKLAFHHQGTAIHFVTDTYPRMSIKNAERGRRAATGIEIVKIQEHSVSQKRPTQWKKFLNAGENKEAFVSYLFSVWKRCPPSTFKNVTVYLAHGKECHAISSQNDVVTARCIPELTCNHEEADTRLILHANYVQTNMPTCTTKGPTPGVVIKSMDTDVLILCISLAQISTVPFLYHTGRGDNIRTIDIDSLQRQIGNDVATALLGLHPFTGCDSVSGFFGKGKIRAFKLMRQHKQYIDTFKEVGAEFSVTEELVSKLGQFVCHLYGQEKAADVNEARYSMFRLGTHAEESLPPNKDSLIKHAERANYQAAIYRRSLEQLPEVPSPSGRGWKLDEIEGENMLQIDWNEMPPAPEEILEFIQCSCKKSKCVATKTIEEASDPGSKPRCCSDIGLRCTDLCTCSRCSNLIDVVSSHDDNDHEELDSEDDLTL